MLLKSVDLQETALIKKLDFEIDLSFKRLDIAAQKQLKILELLIDRMMSNKEVEKEREFMELDFEAGTRLDTAEIEVMNKLTKLLFDLIDLRDKERHPDKIKQLNTNIKCESIVERQIDKEL